ncbi:hypothetical protein IDH44_08085 [Paenibacillus sp. IB182496]|uniref:Zf-HC2 domain-containing protein n=1 Tax=Paenibacillus sabuli TaxID=2772509 RepID=A0A927GR69_9BACL|nr:hypothetical protein [Paenibacillus sabuli]MBD2845148.1 hypothetical protein [Paenibacillus sabuli]
MMNCVQVQEKLGVYWDLPADDPERQAMDRHFDACELCAEQFQMWEESEAMIRNLSDETVEIGPVDRLNRSVMDRIYAEQSWAKPVTERKYNITAAFRSKVAALIAACLALCVSGLIFVVVHYAEPAPELAAVNGLFDTVNANDGLAIVSAKMYDEIPIASISDPLMLSMMPTVPEYWVALSLLGIVTMLLMLNWLSRTRT